MNAKRLRHGLAILLVVLPAAAFSAAEAVTEAQQLMEQGSYEQALDVLDSYLNAAPQDAEGRFTRGLVLVRLNRTDEAIKTFSDLTREYPQLPEPYNNLAVLYAQRGEYDKARVALEAALGSHPSYAMAHENLGDIYAALASAAYDRALTLDPGNKGAQAKIRLLRQLDSLADSGATITARTEPAEPAEAPADELPPADRQKIKAVLGEWAASWSAQAIDRYLGFYSPDFVPEGGASREAWEAQRRNRVGTPAFIKVNVVGEPEFTLLAEDHVRVTFQQSYESDLLTNVANKVLEFRKSGDGWQIVREHAR